MNPFVLASTVIYLVTLLAIYSQFWLGHAWGLTKDEALQEVSFPGVAFFIAATLCYLVSFSI